MAGAQGGAPRSRACAHRDVERGARDPDRAGGDASERYRARERVLTSPEVLAFLARRETYGIATPVERVDTHISIVFLAGDRAYKIKRAVAFSYLDFSTLERREAAARAEVRLNRRTAPDLYLEVRGVVRGPDGGLRFDGAGNVLEWVVVMRRFDQEMLFDRMAARGALDTHLVEALGAEVAAFHASAEPAAGGGAAALADEIAGNAQNLAASGAEIFEPARCDAIVARWRTALDERAELLDRRRAAGKVRRCHGDLHLRNICLWEGRPTLFDCIEFSDRLAQIDVLYDLAFLIMDLRHRGLDGEANRVFNVYLDRNDEGDGIAVLPLMTSLRAGIRAHTDVAAARADPDATRRAGEIAEAQAYLALAERLLETPAPRLVAIGGLSGTGKSTLARALAPGLGPVPGARLVQTDALRKALFGVPPTARLGTEAYRRDVTAHVYRTQREAAAAALRAGYSVVADGVFARPEQRAAIAQVAREAGVPFAGVWLHAPAELLRRRVADRSGDVSDATVAVVDAQLGYDLGALEWTRIDASGDPRATLAQLR